MTETKNTEQQQITATMIGCGNMGSALLKQWLNCGIFKKVTIIKPSPLSNDLQKWPNLFHTDDLKACHSLNSDVIILAIKPQMIEKISDELKESIPAGSLVISVAAGVSISKLQKLIGEDKRYIRNMPNTPCAIGKGVSGSYAQDNITNDEKKNAQTLFDACGLHLWLEREDLVDSITALTGSGPAYLFYFIEALAQSGEKLGFAPQTSEALARQMVIGSAQLVEDNSTTSPKTLRENVTSPGGTTQAALNRLMDGDLQNILNDALECARSRAIELNKNSQ